MVTKISVDKYIADTAHFFVPFYCYPKGITPKNEEVQTLVKEVESELGTEITITGDPKDVIESISEFRSRENTAYSKFVHDNPVISTLHRISGLLLNQQINDIKATIASGRGSLDPNYNNLYHAIQMSVSMVMRAAIYNHVELGAWVHH